MMQTSQEKPEARFARSRAQQAYGQQSRQAQEEQWILAHLPLVRHVVHKVTSQINHRQDHEDLISAGTLGLVKAARAYDPSKEAEFKTYAYIRIRGAVLDELRGRSFVPSAVHKQLRQLRQCYQELTDPDGNPPGDERLAAALEISTERLYRLFEEARRQHFLSIYGLSDEDSQMGTFSLPSSEPGPDDQAERKEILEKLSACIKELPEKDRTVLLLYYERDLNMRETAEVLGVTESRVSQLHAGAIFKLSMKLRNHA
jgi:RNA polymerase sigma factor for flagellar operon FliA